MTAEAIEGPEQLFFTEVVGSLIFNIPSFGERLDRLKWREAAGCFRPAICAH